MAGELTTTLAEFYKTYYRDHLQEDVPDASPASALIMRKGRKIELGGGSINTTWAIRNATGVGFGALSQAGNYPAAGFMSAVNPALGCAHFAATVQWSGHAEAMGSSRQATFLRKKLIRQALDDLRTEIKKYIARMLMWDGTDILCQAANVTGGAAGYFTVKSGGCPIHFFEAGQILTFRDTSSGGSEQLTNASTGGGRILQVDYDLGRIYLTDVSGGANDDYVSWANVYGATVINGIRNLVDSTGTVMGLNRATAANAALRCVEIDLSAAALGPSDVDRLRDKIQDQAESRGSYNTLWLGNRKTRRQATYTTIGQVRFASLGEQTVGSPGVKVGDRDGTKEFVEDEYLLDGELFAFDPSKFVFAHPEGQEGGYLKEVAGSYIFQANATSGVGHSDSQLSYHVWRGNVGLDECRAHGKLVNWTAQVA